MLSHSPRIVSSGLVFCMDPMNQRCYSGGTTLQELSQSKATGVLVSGVTPSGNSFFFDGVNDYITFGDIVDFSTGNSIAIDVWCQRAVTGAENVIISKFNRTGGVGTEDGWIFQYYLNTIYFGVCKDAVYHYWRTGIYTNLNWTNLCFTYTMGSGSTASLYINGIPYSGSWVLGDGSLNIEENPYELRVGNYRYSNADYAQFNGNIGITKIYNRILSSGEVYQNYLAHRSRYVSW